jgi:hypothetical protein
VTQALGELRAFTSPFHNYGAYRKVQEATRDFCIPYMYVLFLFVPYFMAAMVTVL